MNISVWPPQTDDSSRIQIDVLVEDKLIHNDRSIQKKAMGNSWPQDLSDVGIDKGRPEQLDMHGR